MRSFFVLFLLTALLSLSSFSQQIEKVSFDVKDPASGYYLAIRPQSNNIKGTIILFTSFMAPEQMLPETKLHNVAYANDLLTIAVSMKQKLYADAPTIERLNTVLNHVVNKFKVDTATFALAGYDFAGNIALRYTELTREQPSRFLVHPKAVMGIDSPVDLFGLWRWCERQLKRNTSRAGDARYILDLMTKENGAIQTNKEIYKKLTPFYGEEDKPGNEQFLKNVPVRLYYDVDVEGQLKENGKSLYDTNIPDGSELISRLLALGNQNAELITADKPGRNSRGIRTTDSFSMVDEAEGVHWIKNKLNIFDPNTWVPPYYLLTPRGWRVERFPIPIDFAPQIPYNGVEDVRFTPGWDDEKTEQYWSYAFLWWLQGEQKINAALLQKYLEAYYEGLVGRNIPRRNIPADKVVLTKVTIKKNNKAADEAGQYAGTIRMLDYMAQKPIALNFLVQVRNCKAQNKTAVFIELSPQPYAHPLWDDLKRVTRSFDCGD